MIIYPSIHGIIGAMEMCALFQRRVAVTLLNRGLGGSGITADHPFFIGFVMIFHRFSTEMVW